MKKRHASYLAFALTLLFAGSKVMAQPTINSVVLTSTYPTNTVLISGSGFSATPAQLQVWFDGVSGSIVSSSDFSIEVTVPPQARLSNVQVMNLTTGLQGRYLLKFIPTYSGSSFDPTKLAAPLVFSDANEVFDVCSCDLDGDGKPDLAGSKQGTATDIMIQRNTSTIGSLSFSSSTLGTGFPMTNLACGDLNGDGKPELVASRGGGTRNEVFIYRNTSSVGSISFAAVTKVLLDPSQFAFRIVLRDLDLDGKPEIMVSNSFSGANGIVYIYQNQSSGGTLTMNATPVKIQVTGTTTTYGIDAQDLNGDRKPEIIVNQFNSSNLYVVNNTSSPGSISFSTIQTINLTGTLNHMVSADFNEDNKLDIAVTSAFDKKVFLMLNTSSGSTISFAAPLSLDTGDGPFGIDASDIDGDGDIDIICGNIDINAAVPDTEVTVLRSNGVNNSLAFTTLNVNTGKKSRNVKVGDLDGDGKPDIAYTTVTGNSLDVLRNTNCFVPQILNVGPLTICAGQTIRLSSVPGLGVSVYDWKESGSTVSSGAASFYDITTAGNYTVSATSESGTCVTTSASFIVTAGAGSVPTGNPPTTVSTNSPACTGNAIQLNTPAVAGVTYQWTGPNSFTSSAQNPTIPSAAAVNAGVYTLILSNGTCHSTPVTTTVEVADLQSFTVSSSVPSNIICTTGNLTLTVTSVSGHTYQWIKDGLDIGGQTGVTLLVTAAGSYQVRVTNTALSCSTTTSATAVSTINAPVASFTAVATACTNQNITFTDTSTTDPLSTPLYSWAFGDAGTSTSQNPTHAYAAGASYNVTLTVSYSGIAGCSDPDTKSINIIGAVQPTITPTAPSMCPGGAESLSVAGTFNSITWSTGDLGPTLNITQPGNYTVNTTDTNNCPGTDAVTINSDPVPTISVGADKNVIAPGESAQLTASGADTYVWTPSTGLSDPNIANPVASPSASTTYTATGTLTGGCSGTNTIDITVNGDLILIKIPNAFSPNGDGVNDLWVMTGVELYPDCTITLFDAAGRKVYEQKGYTNNWDGTYQGKEVPEGTYYYVFGCSGKTSLSGNVLVAR